MLDSILWLLLGGLLLLLGGELLVRGASGIARIFRIPPLIIGLTIVAACTGAPEMAVSLTGVFTQNPDIALGNVVGSNIANLLLVLGISAMIHPIGVSSRLIKREIPLLIFISALTLLFCIQTGTELPAGTETPVSFHRFPQMAGFLFLGLYLLYSIWVVRTVHEDHDQELTAEMQAQPDAVGSCAALRFGKYGLFFLAGLGMLIFGADRFVFGSVGIATFFGISELVISLTVLAVGTSLPELVVSCVAAFRGKCDIAIGNVIGSNTFNLLAILGTSAALNPSGLRVDSPAFLYDIPIMLGTAIIASILCFTDRKLSRGEGTILTLIYVGYVVFLALR